MSDGPIAHWWKSHAPVRVSTPDNKRVCASGPVNGRGYCGRSKAPIVQVPQDAAKVTCADCLAAARADAAEASPGVVGPG
ncbi:hypothetical protein [Microbacterium sp. NPDC058389]|uniref:hypothetical protein n=1 Tax=Microbacterium sp. NPDC058389 TaxID=3346475 RepID=UPI00364A35B9